MHWQCVLTSSVASWTSTTASASALSLQSPICREAMKTKAGCQRRQRTRQPCVPQWNDQPPTRSAEWYGTQNVPYVRGKHRPFVRRFLHLRFRWLCFRVLIVIATDWLIASIACTILGNTGHCDEIHSWKLTWHWQIPIFNRKYESSFMVDVLLSCSFSGGQWLIK